MNCDDVQAFYLAFWKTKIACLEGELNKDSLITKYNDYLDKTTLNISPFT